MRFLLDANLPRSLVAVIRDRGHEAVRVQEIGLGSAADSQIAAYAQSEGLCLVTRDMDFADIRVYPPQQYAGTVVLDVPAIATSAFIDRLMDYLLGQESLLATLPGKLAIVESGRIRLRGS